MINKTLSLFVFLALASAPGMLNAQEPELVDTIEAIAEVVESSSISAGDTAWMITATALVLFMTLRSRALLRRPGPLEKRTHDSGAMFRYGRGDVTTLGRLRLFRGVH